MLKSHRYTIGFICWMTFITLLSLLTFPEDDGPKMDIPNLDKAVHFTFYFVAALLGCMSVRERTSGRLTLKKALLIISISIILYGIIIEVLQSTYTTQRTGDFYDVVANSIGAFTGAYIIKRLFSGKRQLKWKI